VRSVLGGFRRVQLKIILEPLIKYIEDVEPHGSVGVGGNELHIRYLPHGANSDIEPTKKE
jgi:hypothetical protein